MPPVQDAYRRYGYELIRVPADMALEERCRFVEERIRKNKK